jgi:hypothetical protein
MTRVSEALLIGLFVPGCASDSRSTLSGRYALVDSSISNSVDPFVDSLAVGAEPLRWPHSVK